MATSNTTGMSLDIHKRKIFIQNISPDTTKQSLDDYFSHYSIEWSAVPRDEKGQNKKHGIVTFHSEDAVDAVMWKRDHKIDGIKVFIHRSVPLEGSAKGYIGSEKLIVSALNHKSLTESDIKEYFSSRGKIVKMEKMNTDNNTWTITFEDYDSVDKIILKSPHCIRNVDVSVKKGERDVSRIRSLTPGPAPKAQNNDNSSAAMPKKSNMKQVKMNEEISYLTLPAKKYRIHITNLPANIDADSLSNEFEWDIYNIVMNPSTGNAVSKTECWLKNASNERKIDNFIRDWNGKYLRDFILQCEKEEDELELCNKFQFGRCQKGSDQCHWEHVQCTAKGTCASTCPYGHPLGEKQERNSSDRAPTTTDYRIKITGFTTAISPKDLAECFGLDNKHCYIDRLHNRVGYAVKIKTMKYAKQLMTKWHNKNNCGQLIKCQLELNPTPFAFHQPRSRAGSVNGDTKRQRSRSRPRDTFSERSSQGTSESTDQDDPMTIPFDNPQVERDKRLWDRAVNDIMRSPSMTNLHHEKSEENIAIAVDPKYQLPNDISAGEWEITKKAPNSDGKVLLIRGAADPKHLAVIKIYPKSSLNDPVREIRIMKILQGVKGVSQLIKPENASNNLVQRPVNSDKVWMIVERAPGYSLKELLFERNHQNGLKLPAAIQLALNLTEILQHVHDKGVFHQNLSPDNIMIEWDLKTSIDRIPMTVLNFNQAIIASDRTSTAAMSSTQKWYHAPQTQDGGFSSTVDPSNMCAILFWLLTKIDPSYTNEELPHQKSRDKVIDMIKCAVESVNPNRRISLEEQLKLYLMDTFDRAFGYPHHHPWTINDLKCRLESILQLLQPIEPKLNKTDGIFQELLSISDSVLNPPVTVNDCQRDVFEKASKAFVQAKKHFVENGQTQYEWSDGCCIWVYTPHSSINERRNDDILTYHTTRGRITTSYSVIITCLANCSEKGPVMTLFISSNVNGKTIQIPIGQYSTAQDYSTKVQENFKEGLNNLLLAIYKERKPIQN